jgi:hypothetical protein
MAKAAKKTPNRSAESKRKRAVQSAKWQQEQTLLTNEIGPCPRPENPKRRARCAKSLYEFLVTYFPESTGLAPFSEDHKTVIASIERVILRGGRLANVVYREFAKTTIAENTILWAILNGHKRFAVLAGISKNAIAESMNSIKYELSENELLAEDYPEACFPIVCLEGKAQKARSQTVEGEHTNITWQAELIVLPALPVKWSKCSAAAIQVRPFGKPRGTGHKAAGKRERPDFVLIDDPQDEESAVSKLQVEKNLRILSRSWLHSAGHKKTFSIIVNGTVIAKNDMMEKLLADQAWEGQRISFVKSWSNVHDTFWLRDYATIRTTHDKAIHGDRERAHRQATALYLKNRETADEGCEVSWDYRFTEPAEVSAIQHIYNVLIDDGPDVVATEYQNDPIVAENKFKLTAEWIASKTNNLARRTIPKDAEFVTAHIDVHLRVLYYVICAWSKAFDGAVVDYGTFPKQPVSYFAQSSSPVSMAQFLAMSENDKRNEDAWITAGLKVVTDDILGSEFRREDGAEMKCGMCLVDAKWGEKNKLVKQFCRRHSESGVRIMAAQGYGIGPAQKYFDEYRPEPGTRVGLAWRVGKPVDGDRWVTVDVNWWKSCVASRLSVPLGTPGGIELFGVDPREHSLFADHCVSEYPEETTAKGRTRDVWYLYPGVTENHMWDDLIGCAVGASMLGAQFPEIDSKPYRPRRRCAQRPTAAQVAAMGRR